MTFSRQDAQRINRAVFRSEHRPEDLSPNGRRPSGYRPGETILVKILAIVSSTTASGEVYERDPAASEGTFIALSSFPVLLYVQGHDVGDIVFAKVIHVNDLRIVAYGSKAGSSMAPTVGIWGKITAQNTTYPTRYSFTEWGPDGAVSGGVQTEPDFSSKYVRDVALFANPGIVEGFAWIYPEKGTPNFVMGPWRTKTIVISTPGAISISSTCDPETGLITNVVTQGPPTEVTHTWFYIGK